MNNSEIESTEDLTESIFEAVRDGNLELAQRRLKHHNLKNQVLDDVRFTFVKKVSFVDLTAKDLIYFLEREYPFLAPINIDHIYTLSLNTSKFREYIRLNIYDQLSYQYKDLSFRAFFYSAFMPRLEIYVNRISKREKEVSIESTMDQYPTIITEYN